MRPRSRKPSTVVSATVPQATATATGEVRFSQSEPGPDADEGGHRGGQRHRVVGVEDAGHQAEGEGGDHEPAAPGDQRGADPVGARGPAGQPQAGAEQHQRRRQQPADLAAVVGVEQPQQPGLAPALAAADGADLVAGEPSEAVVAERELEDRVRLAAADVGTAVGRPHRDDRDPPARGRDHRGEGAEQVPQALEQRGAAGDAGRPAPAPAAPGTPASSWPGRRDRPARPPGPASARGAGSARPPGGSRRSRRPAAAPAARRGCRSGTSAPPRASAPARRPTAGPPPRSPSYAGPW